MSRKATLIIVTNNKMTLYPRGAGVGCRKWELRNQFEKNCNIKNLHVLKNEIRFVGKERHIIREKDRV